MLETTDLEQIYQLKQLHAQIGAALAQIEQTQGKIFVTELAKEQADLGIETKTAERDPEALRAEIVVYLQSIRRRSVKYLTEMKDIASRFKKPIQARGPVEAPVPVEVPPVTEEAEELEPVFE